MYKSWYILLVLILAAIYIFFTKQYLAKPRQGTNPTIVPICVFSHQPSGLSYPWLDDIHGGVDKIMFEEPPGSGIWREYTDKIWEIHCKAVNHNPGELSAAHVRAFVNPDTRFARLNFHFRDGTVMEPTKEFYDLEEQWFAENVKN